MNDSCSCAKKKVLLLCHYYPGVAGTINDHIFSFEKYSRNEYFILSNLGALPDWLDLSRFDALIFHYSLIACYDNYISPAGRARIREFQGFKAAFVQDDYRWINDTVNALSYMGIHALFPLTGADIVDAVYPPEKLPNVRKETVLAGYVPQELVSLAAKPYKDRLIDIGYRARKLPAWMGSHTLQKWQIAERFLKDAPRHGLKVDISCREEDRIYGDSWTEFVTNCKATLGTESGASICDFTGDIQRKVEAHLKTQPDADFDTLRELYFKEEDCKYMMNVISPRCFEAAALRTLMILYEGRYSGVLVPWRHYVPLKRDHSNMDEVIHILRSPEAAQNIIDNAYREVAMNDAYSYRAMVGLVDRVMEEEWKVSMGGCCNGFLQDEFEWHRRYCPKAPQRKFNSEVETALFFPSSSVEQVSTYSPSVGVNHGAAIGTDFFEVAFDSPKDISIISIRWNLKVAMAPKNFEIKGVRKGTVVEVQAVSNAEQTAFQLIRLTSSMSKLDALRICNGDGQREHSVLMISILASDASLGSRLLFKSKIKGRYLLHRYWNAMPEWLKRILWPYANVIRSALSQLYCRLTGY